MAVTTVQVNNKLIVFRKEVSGIYPAEPFLAVYRFGNDRDHSRH